MDIGGFVPYKFADSPEYPELLVRWYQYGTFLPILRVHGCRNTEFWNYDSSTQALLMKYTNLRYRLMPYIYTLGAKVTLEQYTITRPLVMDFRTDPAVYTIQDQFMFGSAIMVAPVVEPSAVSRMVYLPKAAGPWTDFWTGKTYAPNQTIQTSAPLETLPLFVKAGSIIPLGPFVQYAEEKTNGELEVRVYTGADGSFSLYEDENDNFHYEHGAYSVIPFSWNQKTKTLTIGTRKGTFPGMTAKRTIAVVFVHEHCGTGMELEKQQRKEILYTGTSVRVKE